MHFAFIECLLYHSGSGGRYGISGCIRGQDHSEHSGFIDPGHSQP